MKRVKDLNKSDIKDISQDFTSADISVYSGQAAFFLILSFFPFLMFFFSLLNLTPLTEQEFMDWVMTIVPSSFHETLEYFTGEIYEGISGGKITATVVVAVFMSSKAFVSPGTGHECDVPCEGNQKHGEAVPVFHVVQYCVCVSSAIPAGDHGVWKETSGAAFSIASVFGRSSTFSNDNLYSDSVWILSAFVCGIAKPKATGETADSGSGTGDSWLVDFFGTVFGVCG